MRDVVIWSGGLDSTAVLYMLGEKSTKKNPVTTLSCKYHYRCNRLQFLAQSNARENYLKWAKRQGHYIEPYEISVKGDAVGDLRLRQHHLFTSLFASYFRRGDIIHWGWKAGELWDVCGSIEFLQSYNKFMFEGMDDPPIHKSILDDKGIHQYHITRLFKKWKVPESCVFTCDHVKGKPIACNHKDEFCDKCNRMDRIYRS
jgi:hypothetical protein